MIHLDIYIILSHLCCKGVTESVLTLEARV